MDYMNDKDYKDDIKTQENPTYIKTLIGLIIVYGVILTTIPYYLLKYTNNIIFLTYFANVDIVCNILAINFPTYFKDIYNISPDNVKQYISFNLISIIALSGIFIHGLSEKNRGVNDLIILGSMLIMSIVTWTLPTQLIPYIVGKIKNKFKVENIDYDILITTLTSGAFILFEGILIHLYLIYYKQSNIRIYLKDYKFNL